MYLTKEEEKILAGEEGETLQKAMGILAALGDIYEADSLIPIRSAQISGVSYKTIGDAGLEWISDLKGTVKVPSVLNPAGMDTEDRERLNIDPHFAEKQIEIINVFRSLGIRPQCTCTPYYLKGFDISFGDHLAWGESSAVSFANSVLGARTNREGGPSAISAALIGKTPNYGLHLAENRKPTVVIRTEMPLSGADFGALGYLAGKIAGSGVPYFEMTDTKGRSVSGDGAGMIVPGKDELKALGAAMAASGAVALYHIRGVTPEACRKDFEAPSGDRETEIVTIERKDLDGVYESAFTESGESVPTDLVTVGCPHCSAEELREIASLLEGKTVVKEFWIFTSREVAGDNADLVRKIEESGAKVVCDTCMVVSPAADRFSCVRVNSGKAYAYVPGMCGAGAVFGTLKSCVDDATGKR